jgi:hypothetical protein
MGLKRPGGEVPSESLVLKLSALWQLPNDLRLSKRGGGSDAAGGDDHNVYILVDEFVGHDLSQVSTCQPRSYGTEIRIAKSGCNVSPQPINSGHFSYKQLGRPRAVH